VFTPTNTTVPNTPTNTTVSGILGDTPTPKPPVAGSGGIDAQGGAAINAGLAILGLIVVSSGLALVAMGRRQES
jgi:hypothetical protein